MERDEIRLMGPQEIAARLGMSRQWTAQLVNRKGFPDPIARLGIGSVWLAADVEAWIAEQRPDLA